MEKQQTIENRPPVSLGLHINIEGGDSKVEEIIKLAGNYGFPMVVAGYLLIRLEPVIKDLQISINSLTIVVARQSGLEMDEISKIVNG
ncbi:MAG: YvrJ protein family protein [Pelotomaculum sp. PtaB.Bin104]|nr:MAG: YvrJ protein family protein [Pelotomaculum sp. PtaB.Bin104]